MMKGLFVIVFVFLSLWGYSQEAKVVSVEMIEKWKAEITGQLQKEAAKRFTANDSKLTIEFVSDTALIERLEQKEMDVDYSTAGMANAMYRAEKAYDVLLNKYYKKLLNKLEAADREVLVQAQRNWLRFRDSESKLSSLLAGEKYSGGGTIQILIVADSYLELTRRRVVELYELLCRVE